ncbi:MULTISPECIES: hypothetical protein [unclassified Nodularia (in: cyanobacteria)]|nr:MULTISPECIES: hypothetical protein [unclassified Nodularia (in: cyanobacteria)]
MPVWHLVTLGICPDATSIRINYSQMVTYKSALAIEGGKKWVWLG